MAESDSQLRGFADAVNAAVGAEPYGCLCVTDDWGLACLTTCWDGGGEEVVSTDVHIPFDDYKDPAIQPYLRAAHYEFEDIVNSHFHTMCGCGESGPDVANAEQRFRKRLKSIQKSHRQDLIGKSAGKAADPREFEYQILTQGTARLTSLGDSTRREEVVGDLVIPATVDIDGVAYPVTSINGYAFRGCFGLTSVTVPSTVTSIGDSTFKECENLASVSIGDSVTSIGPFAFEGCARLTSITLPKSLVSIGQRAFAGCKRLIAVSIPSDVTTIERDAFNGCSSLSAVAIPGMMTDVEDGTFKGCSSLVTATFGSSITFIKAGAFEKCASLTVLVLPSSLRRIGPRAFKGCSGLSELTIPEGVTSIGSGAFDGCVNLVSVSIPDSVSSVGKQAFPEHVSLFKMSSGATPVFDSDSSKPKRVGSKFVLNGIHYTVRPGATVEVSARNAQGSAAGFLPAVSEAFRGELVIPGSAVFEGCSYKVTSIGADAFYDCYDLEGVTIPGSVSEIDPTAFDECPRLVTVIYGGKRVERESLWE